MNDKSPDTISSESRWQGKITDWCKVLRLSKKRQITEVEESFFFRFVMCHYILKPLFGPPQKTEIINDPVLN